MFLTSLLNISFIRWLRLKAGCYSPAVLSFQGWAFCHILSHVSQGSNVLPYLLPQGFTISTCLHHRHLHLPPGHQSPSLGISDTWTTFTFHYQSRCFIWFQCAYGCLFLKWCSLIPSSPKTFSTSATHLPRPYLGSCPHPEHYLWNPEVRHLILWYNLSHLTYSLHINSFMSSPDNFPLYWQRLPPWLNSSQPPLSPLLD